MNKKDLIEAGHKIDEQSKQRVIKLIEQLLSDINGSKFSNFTNEQRELIAISLENQIIIQDGDDITSGKNPRNILHYFNNTKEEKIFNEYNKLG